MQLIPPEAELVKNAGTEVLDQHVSLAQEAIEEQTIGTVLEIESDALLAPVE